jgi:signal transduction histidine kinase
VEFETRFDTGEYVLGDNLDSVIYRVVQEALNNIAKYAKAKKVTISLKRTSQSLRLSIKDDGIGFSLEEIVRGARRSSGMGLRVMKERISLSSGHFSISTAPGSGTIVRAVWNNLPKIIVD